MNEIPPTPTETFLSEGPILRGFGRYELRSRLGRGGMGSVYLAFDRILQRLVVLKIPHSELIRHPVVIHAFFPNTRRT